LDSHRPFICSVRLMIASVGEFLDCVEGKQGNASCISSA
jgi:hypothetical protein